MEQFYLKTEELYLGRNALMAVTTLRVAPLAFHPTSAPATCITTTLYNDTNIKLKNLEEVACLFW